MPAVTRDGAGGVRLELDSQEADVIRRLLGEMRALLAVPRGVGDKVIDRLFPAAYESDVDQEEYASLVGLDLERHKVRALDTASAQLGRAGRPARVALDAEGIGTWLAILTDLRLAIGMRLDVDEDRMSADVDPRDPDAPALSVLHWLGWLQELIIRELD